MASERQSPPQEALSTGALYTRLLDTGATGMSTQDKRLRIGTHYEYPFGGMATRVEWLPQGPDD